MRVALLSDLHGNQVALDAVLADLRRQGADRVLSLGDVATLGPQPSAVIARLRDIGCTGVLGNHDELMLDPQLVKGYTDAPVIADSIDWCRSRLTADDLSFLRGCARTMEIPLHGRASLMLFHGSPRSYVDNIIAQTPATALDEMLTGRLAPVMAAGHTHVQMLRQHRGVLLVNPGSVGMPFRGNSPGVSSEVMTHAEYAIVDSRASGISVTLHRLDLDRSALYDAVDDSELPLASALRAQYA
jgi:predicted phosphodiesterase